MTLLIAVWGAVLGSCNSYIQYKDRTAKIYVRLDVQSKGKNEKGEIVGNVVAYFSNVGSPTISIGPNITILATSSRNANTIRTEAHFLNTKSALNEAKDATLATPITLKPGDDGVAQTTQIVLTEFTNPLDYYSVLFQLSDGTQYLAFFSEPEYIKKTPEGDQFVGFSVGGLAQRK